MFKTDNPYMFKIMLYFFSQKKRFFFLPPCVPNKKALQQKFKEVSHSPIFFGAYLCSPVGKTTLIYFQLRGGNSWGFSQESVFFPILFSLCQASLLPPFPQLGFSVYCFLSVFCLLFPSPIPRSRRRDRGK